MFFILDSETERWSNTNLTPKLKFINVIRCNEEKIENKWTFYTPNEVINFFERIYRETKHKFRIYIHNLDFDIKFLFKTIFARYHLDILKNNTMLCCKCQTKNKKTTYDKKGNKRHGYSTHFEFRDSLILFYHLSIKKLGLIVGLPKIEYSDYDAAITPEYIEYCFRDCEVLFEALKWLKRMFARFGLFKDIENFNLTLPSLAFQLFKLKNQKFEYKDSKSRKRNILFDLPKETQTYFRKSYFGGRTEIFDMKREDVAYCEINGLYQHVMRNSMFPIPPYIQHQNTYNAVSISSILDDKNVFAIECLVRDEGNIPIFCERSKSGKTLFRSGIKRLCLQREEFEFVQKDVLEIYSYWTCASWDELFNYFDEIFKYRKELKESGNPAEQLCKLPPNASYGKFGQKDERTDTKCFALQTLTKSDVFDLLRQGAQLYEESLVLTTKKEAMFVEQNLVIAARIPALGRLRLYKLIQTFLALGVRRIKYVDTDSVVIPLTDVEKIKHLISKESGGFKIEAIYFDFLALAPKEYLFNEAIDDNGGYDGNTANFCGMKLVSQKAKVKGCTNGKMDDLYYRTVSHVRPAKFSECLKRKQDIETALEIHKQKRTFYDKRHVNHDYSTTPLSVLEDSADNMNIVYQALGDYYETMFMLCYESPQQGKILNSKVKNGMDRTFAKAETMEKALTKYLITDNMDYDEHLMSILEMKGWDKKLTHEENLESVRKEWKNWVNP